MPEKVRTHAETMTVGPYPRPSRDIGGLGIAGVLHHENAPRFVCTPQDAHEAAYAGSPVADEEYATTSDLEAPKTNLDAGRNGVAQASDDARSVDVPTASRITRNNRPW